MLEIVTVFGRCLKQGKVDMSLKAQKSQNRRERAHRGNEQPKEHWSPGSDV